MFLQQTMTPWFAIQRVSQIIMILLAIAILILPILHSQKEAEAVSGAEVIALVVAGTALVVSWMSTQNPKCSSCGSEVSVPEAHWSTHSPCGTGYWNCNPDSHRCTCSVCGERQWCCDPHDHSSS